MYAVTTTVMVSGSASGSKVTVADPLWTGAVPRIESLMIRATRASSTEQLTVNCVAPTARVGLCVTVIVCGRVVLTISDGSPKHVHASVSFEPAEP